MRKQTEKLNFPRVTQQRGQINLGSSHTKYDKNVLKRGESSLSRNLSLSWLTLMIIMHPLSDWYMILDLHLHTLEIGWGNHWNLLPIAYSFSKTEHACTSALSTKLHCKSIIYLKSIYDFRQELSSFDCYGFVICFQASKCYTPILVILS